LVGRQFAIAWVLRHPLRVLKNDGGSEVVFTPYRHAGVTDEAYEKDAATIAADLERLGAALRGGRT
jgi:hypothetical protein